ncbi:non-specific serine/threonine protein kinase [Filimonas lacunae]|uniref:Non-specific serine/threonine protein kinase n=1 Tax=Filimonas lacunae TaxID=477680 RepID=A0A173MPH5_9BACT|nr:DEAD/DEAH box helicase [Filimonas lacunae]BAV09544.1 DEAD/DEAH box helicase-like protein [Filimonas lacunae]SIS74975.1 non-specific serine/threonine protein kinase [Filimonas lacunae]
MNTPLIDRSSLAVVENENYEIGFLFNMTTPKHIGFQLEPVVIRQQKGRKSFSRLFMDNNEHWAYLNPLPEELFYLLFHFSDGRLFEFMVNSGSTYLKNHAQPWLMLNDKDILRLRNHYLDLLHQVWPYLLENGNLYVLKEGNFSDVNIKPLQVSEHFVEIHFTAAKDAASITIQMNVQTVRDKAPNRVFLFKSLFFLIDDILHLPSSAGDVSVLDMFKKGELRFPVRDRQEVTNSFLIPLQQQYPLECKEGLQFEVVHTEPQTRIALSEFNGQYLMLQPQFMYDDVLIDYDEETDFFHEKNEVLYVIRRNKTLEKNTYEHLRNLHAKFKNQRNNRYYYVPFDEVMKGNWFIKMNQQLQDAGYTVYGLQDLKRFKYNTNTPRFEIIAKSTIDWFDLKIKAYWGDQEVGMKDIRKAILNRQDTILLKDGTLGVIPHEWFDKYGMLFKVGNEADGKLQLNKLHYSVLDELQEQLADKKLQKEIEEKKRRLLQCNELETQAPSTALQASLRPYQLAGFQWMQSLDQLGWGGCLADDMGLGKTLQTITFIQYLKEKYPGSTQLVVCPTSLIFNWEAEIQKFCPSMQYLLHYGQQRDFTEEQFEKVDVVLTSYGVVRNDLTHLQSFKWNYIILDESQTIKNADAQVSKAVYQLQSTNKLILSGTPVQNNTFDLYSQFHFVNPGLLGGKEFFRREFAQPIDKGGDKEKATKLRQLIYPFILRRTKEQVATDLPDKTEMVLWCTMNTEQRAMYDEYKDYYRDALLKRIDEEGMGKAGIYVMEGLLKLRQICDHPQLVKEHKQEVHASVKADELLREIEENTGLHKLLVFSQFTEMLHLIKDELEKAGISYCYLDGSTSLEKRKQEVQRFQEEGSTVKVFLISLKAGGVGLNLTAADYVYLVDPWWNPAAEQQAIDRAHRIGQTQKIFAYKMICKDTVEEKILLLQQKKQALADELVGEESGFVKKLSRDDIAFLFS